VFGGSSTPLPFTVLHRNGFADLDGKAYEDYYCGECVEATVEGPKLTDEAYAAMAWADIDAALEEPLNEACERLNDCDDDRIEQSRAGEVIQGVCKDCQSGTLNNLLEQAFVYVSDNDDNEFLVCKNCGSQRLDLL
jgi:hypothetical protein